MLSLKIILLWAIQLMVLAIFASVILSWLRSFRARIPYDHPLVRAIDETAELILRPIRQSLPTAASGLDFSPVVALIILAILRAIITRL